MNVKVATKSLENLIREFKKNVQQENLAYVIKTNRYYISKATKKAALNAQHRRAKKAANQRKNKK